MVVSMHWPPLMAHMLLPLPAGKGRCVSSTLGMEVVGHYGGSDMASRQNGLRSTVLMLHDSVVSGLIAD
jgi:hypothetical protein